MIAIIGGGLAGLTCAIALTRNGFDVLVIEKKSYPFHRVCGEYVSNEVRPWLLSLGIDVDDLEPSQISKVRVSSPSGRILENKLDLGGFGISRYTFDNALYQKARVAGVRFLLNTRVNDVCFHDNSFDLELNNGSKIQADLVIASYGKRSNLDQKINRKFFYKRSPYFGVKYHIKTDFPDNITQLDNFEGGYCGINKIEEDKYNLCYLSENASLRELGSVKDFEENKLFKNPHLKHLFQNSDFLFDKPLVINEITFEQKSVIEGHILFSGDAAGMITPLCGNGMAMAIHGAKILSDQIIRHRRFKEPLIRQNLEEGYRKEWVAAFSSRLKTGRVIQSFFGNSVLSDIAVYLMNASPGLTKMLIKKTHGQPF